MADKKSAKALTDVPTGLSVKPLRYVVSILWDTANATINRDIRPPFNPDFMILRTVCPQIGANPPVLWRIRVNNLLPDDKILCGFYDAGGAGVAAPGGQSLVYNPLTEFQMHNQVNGNYTFELLNTAGAQATSAGFLYLQLEFMKC